jgi:protein-S-isoprenylcysteine O-methyltransferase Ste14
MKTLFIGLRALVFMSGFILAATWLVLAIRPLDRYFGWAPPAWLAFAAPLLVLPGAALVVASGGFFVVRGRGTPALFDPPRQFVATGPYRLVRNPMYVGALLLLAGFALLWRSATLLLAIPVVFGGAHLLVTLYEEPVLHGKFGAAYENYCHDVSRWLPCGR